MVLMSFDTPLSWAPDLEKAINRHPLTVPPTTSLADAIAMIGQAHSRLCLLTDDLSPLAPPAGEARVSCLLVVQGQELLGILTERDVVRLTAQGINLTETTVADVMVHPLITLPQQSAQDIFAALFLFRRYRIRHLPIVDDQGHLIGVISHESIRQILRPANLLRFRRVSDVMTSQVVQAPLTATVLQLAQLMAEHRVSCVVITQRNSEDNDCPVGIVTERDLVQFQAVQIDLHKTRAQTVMSTPLFLLSPEDSLWTAHQEMQKRRVGRLVVSWNWGRGLGIVTQTSLLRVFDPMEMYGVIENLQQTIQQLESERSPSLPSPPADLLPQRTRTPSEKESAGDRELLLALLDNAYKDVKYMLANLDIVVEQRRSLLQSVLDKLEYLGREISS
ncbi:MAG: CBS domain-containing protein [Microcystis sp.]|jgi:CBS domain-containing protein|uniref:CBS domain-containing protein n=1 Tax=Microcystis sp. TaxID=1127 RepID=UPI00391D1BF9